ncbi:MAG: RdgB/HAM1 family non-canonical purine NTP pyrophosphatase [Bacteroidota bacterium]
MDLVFATNNPHKLKEIRNILGDNFRILSLKDINFNQEIPETRNTLEGNASQKAFFIYNYLRAHSDGYPSLFYPERSRRRGGALACRSLGEGRGRGLFADDTGLEIEALNGHPGVRSARYAGEQCNFEDNMNKVLKEMKYAENRKARFRTVISLIINGKEKLFEGIVDGTILKEKRGNQGFGYDPIFMPNGYDLSFAEMSLDDKNKISHRGNAVMKLVEYLTANIV